MAVTFDYAAHRKLWLLMRDNIEDYITTRYIPTFYDAEVTIDDLKATMFIDGNLGIEYKNMTHPPLFYCFACQYAWDELRGVVTEADKKERCPYCPLVGWEADKCYMKTKFGEKQEGLFHQLCVAVENKEIETAKDLCERIANLDIREGVITWPLQPTTISVETIPQKGSIIIQRYDAFYKLPINVYVLDEDLNSRTYNRYINSDGILQIGYKEDKVIIANENDEPVTCVIIDPDTRKYNTPIFRTLNPGRDFTVDRTNNFSLLPTTVLVKDACRESMTYDWYIDCAPFCTVIRDNNTYCIRNDIDETVSYVITSSPIKSLIKDQLIGANASFTTGAANSLINKPPIVLIKDLEEGSTTYGKYIDGTGLVTVSLSEQIVMIHNDMDISADCRMIWTNY